jgi:signal transduction histidine kinase
MRVPSWFWPARHPVVSFLAVTALPAAALFWLSWRSLEQDRLLETQRVQKRLEQAAGLAVTALQQTLAEVERSQGEPLATASEDALVAVFGSDRVDTRPGNRLLYYPVLPSVPEIPVGVFSRGQDLENPGDYAGAVAAFRETARSADARIRAGARLRIARNLKKAGQLELALAEWNELAKAGPVPLDGGLNGIPADLVARRARYALLLELKRPAEAQQEAETLARDLNGGRWRLDRATYLYYVSQIGCEPPEARAAFADAVEWLWSKRKTASSGRETAVIGGRPFTLLWRGPFALAATPRYVEIAWLQPLAPLLKNQGVRLSLGGAASSPGTERTAAATGLPWNVRISSADPEADLRQFAARRRFLLATVGLLGALLCAATYAIARGVNRELAAARLQTEFVSAVSHEFRTPLTSLQQITEAFAEGRVAETERRSFFEAQGRATQRLRRLVESLLDFGRMEAGAKPYRLRPTDAAHLVHDVVGEFQREKGDCSVELTVEEPALGVSADPDALTHAIWNLLDNAVKYSPQCRTVWVKAGRRDGAVAIGVRDQGLGIPQSEQKAIFGKFVRGAAAQSNGIKGAGIGLSMVSHIVAAHRGRVEVESAPGAGSTFTIFLPADG